MLHSFLYAPFATAARQAQFDAVQLALEADSPVGTTRLLLGNLGLGEAPLDAVLVTGHSVTALFFLPGGGRLSVAPTGAWQLNGQPLPESAALDHCREQLLRQRPALAAWLTQQLGAAVSPAQITGLGVFEAPVSFGPEVETHLRGPFEPRSFQLLGTVEQLPHFLRRPARPAIQLPEAVLRRWADELAGDEDAEEESAADAPPMGFWEQQARQLWRWLGAEDVPHDAPYGGYAPPDAAQASQQEKARLEQIRQQVRAELHEQSQAAAAREAAREQTIAQLQAQLAQATAVAPEAAALQARLAAETREKAALAEAMRAAQAESAARNQELDARINQLAALIRQLPAEAAPTAELPVPRSSAPPAPGPSASGRPGPSRRRPPARPWQLRWSRVAVVAAGLGWTGAAVWGVSHLTRQFFSHSTPTHSEVSAAPRRRPAARPAAVDSTAGSTEDAAAADQEAAPDSAEATVIQAPLVVDSAQVMPAVEAPDLDEPAPGN